MANTRATGIPVSQLIGGLLKVSKKLKVEELDDAIVDGKLTVGLTARLIIMRSAYKGGKQISVPSFCIIKTIESDGFVNTYDETRQQMFGFNINGKDLPMIKVWETKT